MQEYEKVIDIYSKGEYPANELSNFFSHKFMYDGVKCESMEGFLQSLKFKKHSVQKNVCLLSGKEAKEKGSKKILWKIFGNVYWKDKKIKRRSKEFKELILSAYISMYEQCDSFRKALSFTKNCKLIHSVGTNLERKTILTESEFLYCLNYLIENKL